MELMELRTALDVFGILGIILGILYIKKLDRAAREQEATRRYMKDLANRSAWELNRGTRWNG